VTHKTLGQPSRLPDPPTRCLSTPPPALPPGPPRQPWQHLTRAQPLLPPLRPGLWPPAERSCWPCAWARTQSPAGGHPAPSHQRTRTACHAPQSDSPQPPFTHPKPAPDCRLGVCCIDFLPAREHARMAARAAAPHRRRRPQQHLRDGHPVGGMVRAQQRLQVGAPHKGGGAPVQALRQHLQQAHGDVAVGEGQPLQQEAAGGGGGGCKVWGGVQGARQGAGEWARAARGRKASKRGLAVQAAGAGQAGQCSRGARRGGASSRRLG
jgi:hypothetical protein